MKGIDRWSHSHRFQAGILDSCIAFGKRNSHLGSHTFGKLRCTHIPGNKMTNTIPKGAKKKPLYFPVATATKRGTLLVYTCCLCIPTGLTFLIFNEELLIAALVYHCFIFSASDIFLPSSVAVVCEMNRFFFFTVTCN